MLISHVQRMIFVAAAAVAMMGACIDLERSDDGQELAGSTEQALSTFSDGPFTNTQSLIDYWSATPTSSSLTQIYVNGRKVYERPGFGPAFVKQYFDCADSDIYAVCASGVRDGHTNFNTLVSRFPAATSIYRDGVLVRQGSNGTWAEISSCSGDQSYYGSVTYSKVIRWNNGFIPYYSSCYP